MEIGSFASRDPRLSSRGNRSLPTRSSIPETQRPQGVPGNSTPPDRQNAPDGNNFIRGISELVQAAVVAANNKSEKERLQKKRDAADELLRKAKAQSGFPSVGEFFQKVRNDEDADMARIDECIRQSESICHRLENELKTKWTVSVGAHKPSSEDRINRLEQDLKLTRNKTSKFDDDNERLAARSNSLAREIKKLEEILNEEKILRGTLGSNVKSMENTLATQQKSFGSYTNSLGIQTRNIEQNTKNIDANSQAFQEYAKRLEQLEKEPTGTSPDALQTLSTRCQNIEDKLKQQTAGWEQKLDALWKTHEDHSVLREDINKKIAELQQTFTQINKPQAGDPKLELTVQTKFEELHKVLSTKDDLQFAEMEDIQRKVKNLMEDSERVTGELNNLKLANPVATIEPRVTNLATSHQQTLQRIETLRIALHSLETRYNMLSTENLYQQMVGAMQEMYPSLDQVVAALNSHKQLLESELPRFKAKIEQIENQMKEVTLSQNELNTMKHDRNNLSQSLAALWAKHHGQSQWLKQEDFREMKSTFDTLSEKYDRIEQEANSRKIHYESLLEKLRRERDDLKNQFSRLDNQFQKLDAGFTEFKSDKTSANAILTLTQHVESLQQSTSNDQRDLEQELDKLKKIAEPSSQRIESLQQSTLNDRRDLEQQLNELKKIVEPSWQRIESLEQSTTNGHQGLQQQLDQLKKAVKPRSLSPVHSVPAVVDKIVPSTREGTSTSEHQASDPNELMPVRKKSKKKRPHSDDEISPTIGVNSARSFGSPASSIIAPGGTATGSRKPKRRKKKIRSMRQEEAIIVPDD